MSAFAVEYLAKVCNVVFYLSICGALFFLIAALWENRLTMPQRNNRLICIFLGLAVLCIVLMIFVPFGDTARLLKG